MGPIPFSFGDGSVVLLKKLCTVSCQGGVEGNPERPKGGRGSHLPGWNFGCSPEGVGEAGDWCIKERGKGENHDRGRSEGGGKKIKNTAISIYRHAWVLKREVLGKRGKREPGTFHTRKKGKTMSREVEVRPSPFPL